MNDDERIELVLAEMAKIGNGRLSVQKFLAETVKDSDPHSYQRIISFLVNRGFAKRLSTIPVLEILPDGRDIVKSGGYIKYLERLKEKDEAESQWMVIRKELDEVNLKFVEFNLKNKKLPYLFSGIAILISLAALIISIFK